MAQRPQRHGKHCKTIAKLNWREDGYLPLGDNPNLLCPQLAVIARSDHIFGMSGLTPASDIRV